jgi:hypothetical protein
MPEIAQEARFMGAVTALTMHEMQNILAIIRESAGLMGDILKVNARVDFKHRPNMERTLEHISSHVDRGKGCWRPPAAWPIHRMTTCSKGATWLSMPAPWRSCPNGWSASRARP